MIKQTVDSEGLMGLGPVACVVGARPNYMKMAPIVKAFAQHTPAIPALLIHTGQHYDPEMNDKLFSDLGLPRPDINLEVGSGTHAVQTAEIMKRFEPVLDEIKPSCVLVAGDVNSTIACGLVAVKKGIPVIHLEAGLRSNDRGMPEEINRILTDQISNVLYTTERLAEKNLLREGIAQENIQFVGNVMIDSLRANLDHAVPPTETLKRAGVDPTVLGEKGFGVVTLHRPSNVDQVETFAPLLDVLCEVAERLPLVFAMHPRTRRSVENFGLTNRLASAPITVLPPQGYLEMLGLMSKATVVLTDSGGIQEETTALAVPCITLRENTERPITVDHGTNTLAGRDRTKILACLDDVLTTGGKRGRTPEYWDGHAAERVAAHLWQWLNVHASRR